MIYRIGSIKVDAIKYSYRQTKDGHVMAFVLHPHDDLTELTNAPIGSQWQMTLVPLDEDGNADAQVAAASGPGPYSYVHPRSWDSLSLTQQAGILCQDPKFHDYLKTFPRWNLLTLGKDSERAAVIVHSLCRVHSRADINNSSSSREAWLDLVNKFRDWQTQNTPREGTL